MLAAMALGGGLLTTGAWAQAGDSARLSAIMACGAIDRKSDRLSCYDAQVRGTARQTRAERRAAELGVPAPGIVVTAPQTADKSFGSEDLKKTAVQRAQEIKQIIARTTSATDDGIGHWTITLENGTRWKMSELSPNFIPPRPGDTVRLRRASLGSFLMDVNYQASVRVTRIQ